MPDDRQTKTAAPLTEGRVHKGGLNPASRVYERPPGPGAMRALTDGKTQAAEQDDSYERGYAAGERRVYLNMLSGTQGPWSRQPRMERKSVGKRAGGGDRKIAQRLRGVRRQRLAGQFELVGYY